uniref:Complexin 3 n=1 Tax=Nothobranchius furzeri TaxID=105023 RepID=A0A8C6VY46_NOTFU
MVAGKPTNWETRNQEANRKLHPFWFFDGVPAHLGSRHSLLTFCCRVIICPFSCRREREANFAQKKAERATVRTHFREKYRLPKNELDETQIQQAGDDVVLPTELAKMIAEDNQEETHKQSVLGQLSNIQNVDIDQLKDKAQATLEDLKKQTENCSLM